MIGVQLLVDFPVVTSSKTAVILRTGVEDSSGRNAMRDIILKSAV